MKLPTREAFNRPGLTLLDDEPLAVLEAWLNGDLMSRAEWEATIDGTLYHTNYGASDDGTGPSEDAYDAWCEVQKLEDAGFLVAVGEETPSNVEKLLGSTSEGTTVHGTDTQWESLAVGEETP